MGGTRKLSWALWSTVASIGAAACGDPDTSGQLADAPPISPAAPVAVVAPKLTATAECGVATPPPVELMVANSGTGDLVILSAVADGGFTVTTALPVTVKPGAQVALVVAPPAAVIGTDRGGGTKDGTLILTTNEAASEHTVELTANVLGANLAFTDEAGAAVVLAFSATFPACPAPKTVFLRNTGTSALVVGEASASGLVAFGAFSGAFSGFSGGTLEPGAFATQDIRPIADVVCTGSGMVTYQVTGTVCTVAQPVLVGAYNINGASGSSCFCS